jgi:nucleoside 2-deoxyribosyltransferase
MTSFYLAGPFPRMLAIREVADGLTRGGHTVTSEWVYGVERENIPEDIQQNVKGYLTERLEHDKSFEIFSNIAITDLREVDEADVFVKFHTDDIDYHSGGKFVEVGYAMAKNKLVIVLGKPENVFDWHPSVLSLTEDTFLENIDAVLEEFLETGSPVRLR